MKFRKRALDMKAAAYNATHCRAQQWHEIVDYWRCIECQTVFAGHMDEDDVLICDEMWSSKRGVAGCPFCGSVTADPWIDEVMENIRSEIEDIYSIEEGD